MGSRALGRPHAPARLAVVVPISPDGAAGRLFLQWLDEGDRRTEGRLIRITEATRQREAEEAAAAAEAAASPTAGLEYTEALPNGEPGYVLPAGERTLSCVGYEAASGQCVGD